MALRNYIIDGWKAASLRSGFEEYDGPIFELLKMYQIKSGDEIVEQLFNLTDRGGRHLAIRPEITPTLARMVNQQVNSLPRPIKWFSVPRLCRAERPQKGRLREFFQWNVDVIGTDDVTADAEVIFTAIDYLRTTGLTEKDIVVKISSRKMLAAMLEAIGIAESDLDKVYAVLDKKARLPAEAFTEMLAKIIPDEQMREKTTALMSIKDIESLRDVTDLGDEPHAAVDELGRLFNALDTMGVKQFCQFDIGIVRGLAYYTGPVFEIYDRQTSLRAVCGGGRYDNLLKDFGGPSVPATGFGMGDCVLEILLREKGLLNEELPTKQVEYFVAYTDTDMKADALKLAAALRTAGKNADMAYKPASFKKILKQATAANAKNTIIIAQEYLDNKELIVKDMATGQQETILQADLLARLSG
jgi:histidyl-tRNA synthetase